MAPRHLNAVSIINGRAEEALRRVSRAIYGYYCNLIKKAYGNGKKRLYAEHATLPYAHTYLTVRSRMKLKSQATTP